MVNAPTMIEKQNVIQIKILIGARTHLNYYIKKNNYTYTKEFDKLRKEQNLTQSELAQIMQTTQDTISLWELGKSMPDIIALVKLAKLFNVSTDYLLDLEA